LTLPGTLGHACSVRTRPPVFVGSGFVAKYPTGGGNFWVPLQYLLGLRDLGYDAWWLEYLWTCGDAVRDRAERHDRLDFHAGERRHVRVHLVRGCIGVLVLARPGRVRELREPAVVLGSRARRAHDRL
jgi:hypothetical protein